MNIPKLERHCGSWVVVDNRTGKGILETFDRKTVEAIAENEHIPADRYEILTALQYLARI